MKTSKSSDSYISTGLIPKNIVEHKLSSLDISRDDLSSTISVRLAILKFVELVVSDSIYIYIYVNNFKQRSMITEIAKSASKTVFFSR